MGTPVVASIWHCVEAQTNLNSYLGAFTPFSISGRAGHIESLYMFLLDAGGAFAYVDMAPGFLLDGHAATLGAGLEDSFGGSWAWDAGQDVYFAPEWGTFCSPYMLNLYGFGCGNSSYRYFTATGEPGFYFTNSASFSFTNESGNNQTNLFLITYLTP
jgi:hypothetical protein